MYYWAYPFSPSINGSSEIGGRYSSGRPELNLECLQHVYKMSSSVAESRRAITVLWFTMKTWILEVKKHCKKYYNGFDFLLDHVSVQQPIHEKAPRQEMVWGRGCLIAKALKLHCRSISELKSLADISQLLKNKHKYFDNRLSNKQFIQATAMHAVCFFSFSNVKLFLLFFIIHDSDGSFGLFVG